MFLNHNERQCLRAELDRTGISQRRLAEMVRCSQTTVCNALAGRCIGKNLLEKIVRVLRDVPGGDPSFGVKFGCPDPSLTIDSRLQKCYETGRFCDPAVLNPCPSCGLPCKIEIYHSTRLESDQWNRYEVTYYRCPSQIKTRKQLCSVRGKARATGKWPTPCPVHKVEVRLKPEKP